MTNLPGMIVLKFATAKIIEVFFFRMGFTLTIVGALHGLIFLPVLLSYIGPRRNPEVEKLEKYSGKNLNKIIAEMKENNSFES